MDLKLRLSKELLQGTGRVLFLEATPGRQRQDLLESCRDRLRRNDAAAWQVSCDFSEGGPWAGVAPLLLDLIPEVETRGRDLLIRHDYELVSVLPTLRSKLSPRNPSLTDLAGTKEQVRLYPADRALRILHGLIDFLVDWKRRIDPDREWWFLCDNYDRAGYLAGRFFGELMRRRAASDHLGLLVAGEPDRAGEFRERFLPSLHGPVFHFDFEPEPAPERPPEDAACRGQEIEERISGDAAQAELCFPQLIRLWERSSTPDRVLPWLYEAFSIYTSRGFYWDALAYGEGALAYLESVAPEDESRRWKIVNKLFACHCTLKRPERALEVVEDTLEKLKAPYFRALAHYVLAMLHARYLPARNLALAERHLEIGVADLQRAELPEDELQFQIAFNRNGLALIRHFQGASTEAIELCREGFEKLQSHLHQDQHRLHRSVLLYNIAQVYSSLGHGDEAVHYYTAAMEMDPNYSEYYNERGNLKFRQRAFDEAYEDYRRALELSPPFAEVRTNLGHCLFKLNRIEEAIAAYDESLDLAPEQPDVLVMRAQCREALEQWQEALADYSASLALNPEQPTVLANRACLLYNLGDLEASLADLDQAIALSPEAPDLYQNRAVALSDLGRHGDAARDLEAYMSLCPEAEDFAEVSLRLEALRSGGLAAAVSPG